MKIRVNGADREVAEALSLSGLLETLELDRDRVAVERNRELVRKADFERTLLAEGDELELVTLVGGG